MLYFLYIIGKFFEMVARFEMKKFKRLENTFF
jgi:hypothetical protein